MPRKDTGNLGDMTPLNFEDVQRQAEVLMGLGLKATEVESCVLRLKKTFGWSFYNLLGENHA
jgi:hypothetical protein